MPPPVDHRQLVLEHLRALGCTCREPDVTFGETPRPGAITDAHIGHDLDCALMKGQR
jgi:hypothetical protein